VALYKRVGEIMRGRWERQHWHIAKIAFIFSVEYMLPMILHFVKQVFEIRQLLKDKI